MISRKPDLEGREPAPAQAAQRERSRRGQATVYGKMVTHARARCARVADPAARAIYEEAAARKGKPVFSPSISLRTDLTVAGFFHAPSVDEVDLSGYTGAVGDPIVVQASDDFDPSTTLPSTEFILSEAEGLRAGVVWVRPSTLLRTGVALTDADGNPIEGDDATETPPDSGRWAYTATQAVSTGTTVRPSASLRTGIAVTAEDRPGGVGTVAEEKSV